MSQELFNIAVGVAGALGGMVDNRRYSDLET